MSDKEAVLALVKKLPKNASLSRISDEVAMMQAIAEGEADLDAGRTLTHEQVGEFIQRWIQAMKSAGPSERTGTSSRRPASSKSTTPKRRRAS